jgi:GR25 family glycosyltransferase involved in LPS biosynthesis
MERIDKLFYINLDERKDRKENVEKQLEKIKFPKDKIFRFEAIKDEKGYLGCTKSHYNLIKNFMESEDQVWSIMEDDIMFHTNKEIIDIYINEFLEDQNSIIFHGSVTFLEKENYSKNLNRVNFGYTTTWYILKKQGVIPIFNSFKTSLINLLKGASHKEAACDVVWIKDMKENIFVTTKKLICSQTPSYSDISKQIMDYRHLYTNYENINYINPHLTGGLGNQLFMIANAYAYSLRTNSNFIIEDKIHCNKRPSYFDNLLSNLKIYLGENINFPKFNEPFFRYSQISEDFSKQNISFYGYFQSEKYFKDYEKEIRELFKTPESIENIIQKIKESQFDEKEILVALHIRRTDYLKLPDFHPVLNKEYYESGKKIIEERLGFRPTYLYFGDDKPWVLENFTLEFNDKIIEFENDYEEFVLMSKCNHYIIANSSFSWWASWLSEAKEKIIIAPEKWFGPSGPQDYYDIYTENMIKI